MDFDIVGDVHGNAGALEALLGRMDYTVRAGSWTPPAGRKLIFVGDLIDRGKRQIDSIQIARAMVDSGHALAIIGNHELNAMAWSRGYREDSPKNRKQHEAFLDEVGEGGTLHRELMSWFLTLPLWLELPELRVVHACWDPWALDIFAHEARDATLDEALLKRATSGVSNSLQANGARPACNPVFAAAETLTKGIEVDLPSGLSYRDKDGHERFNARIKWWLHDTTFADGAFLPRGFLETLSPDVRALMDQALPSEATPGYDNEKPLFLGHYWRTGLPELLTPYIACVDYSAGKGGPLVAYQWRGEERLDAANFISSH